MGIASQLDRSLFDTIFFDDTTSVPDDPTESTDEITFNGYGLQNAAIITSLQIASGPTRDFDVRAYPRANGAYVENTEWRENVVTLQGIIKKSTQSLLETEMDTMRKNFAVPAGVLKITHAGVARYYDCYAKGMEGLFATRQGYNITICPWAIDFVCFNPFARSKDRSYFSNPSAITANITTIEIPYDATAPSESNAYFMVATAGTMSKLRWENTDTGEAIELTASFNDGDYVRIDGEGKVVYLNGIAVDYDGTFPSLDAGKTSMELTITGAGFSITMSENNYKRYY